MKHELCIHQLYLQLQVHIVHLLQLELIDNNGDIIITIADFNSSSFKIVKNNLHKGDYTVFLTEQETQKVDIGTISF